jgi:hypothetical protein
LRALVISSFTIRPHGIAVSSGSGIGFAFTRMPIPEQFA